MVLISFLILTSGIVLAQDKPSPFLFRFAEITFSKYTCTSVTRDGRLRREVTSMHLGQPGRPEIFEGAASEEDVSRLKAMVAQPNFVAAAGAKEPVMILPDGRVIFAEVNFDNNPKVIRFVDKTGGKPIPSYLAGLFSFAEEVEKRRMPRLKGKIEPMCRLPAQR